LPSFTTQLDWAVFDAPGLPSGAIRTTPWVATSNGIGITVSQNAGANGGLITANNFDSVFEGGHWVAAENSINPQPYAFRGHFDAPPNTQPGSPIAPGMPGDHLMGLYLNGVSNTSVMTINFAQALDDLAFRLASTTTSTFDTTIRIFSGINGVGQIGSLSLTGLAGGGTCTSLFSAANGGTNVIPCNDAPFAGFLNFGTIRSVTISSSDPTGFYLGNLFVSEPETTTPEPTPLMLCGLGVALLVLGKKRWRRS